MSTNTTDTSDRTVSRRQALRAGGVAAATVATAGTSIPLASAYHEGQTLEGDEGFFSGGTVVGEDDRVAAIIGGSRGLYRGLQLRFEDLDDAEEIAADLQAHINDNSTDYVTFVNDRELGSSEREVLQLTIIQDEDEVPLYLVAPYDADAEEPGYQSLELLSEPAYEDAHGDREPDEKAVLSGGAAKEAPDDLERLHTEFVAENEDVGVGFASEMASKYGSSAHVSSTLLGDDL